MVGKTTTVTTLASMLNKKGHKTLIVDADLQGNTSDTFRVQIEGKATLYDVILDDDRIPAQEAIQSTEYGDIIASDPLLRRADEILKNDVDGPYRLADALKEVKDYEYIVIDTGPALNSILHSCLIAADKVIIPLNPERYAIQGLSQLQDTIAAVRKRQNPNLEVDGLLLTRFKGRTNLSRMTREALEKLAEDLDTKLYRTVIRDTVNIGDAQARRMLLEDYAPKGIATIDYSSFVDEFLGGNE